MIPSAAPPRPPARIARCPLGFGAAQIGNLYRAVSDAEAFATLDAAARVGVTLFDTAPFYGHGLSELRLGQFLRARPRDSYVLSTKVGCYMLPPTTSMPHSVFAAPLPFLPVIDYSYAGTLRSLEQSAARLGIPRFDIVLIHDLDRRNHGALFEHHLRIARDGAIRALHELKRDGAVGAIGIAVNEPDVGLQLLAEMEVDVALLAGCYSLLDQSGLEFLAAAGARGAEVLLASVFNSGILAAGTLGVAGAAHYRYAAPPAHILARVRAFEAVCARHGVPLAAVALRFAAAHPAVASVVVGASQPASIARAAAAMDCVIPTELWSELVGSALLEESTVPGAAARQLIGRPMASQ